LLENRALAATVVSIISQVAGLLLGLQTKPLLNPEWTKSIVENFFPNIPFLGPYLTQIPIEVWAVILSFMLVAMVAYWLLGQISGNMGLIVALGLGALIVMLWYGLMPSFNILSG